MRQVCILFLLLTACAGPLKPVPQSAPPPRQADLATDELVLVTTTDFHSSLHKAEGLAQVIRTLRAAYGDHMLYLDGGDQFQGSLEGNLSKGRAIVQFFNAIGLDAAAIGNHELDYGPDVAGRASVKPGEDGMGNLKARVREAKYPWLSANIVLRKGRCKPSLKSQHCNALGQKTQFAPRAVFTRAGMRVCVIGATTVSTPHITQPAFVKDVSFEPLAKVVEAEARFFREHGSCDFVVLTAHAGLVCDPDGDCKQEGDRAEILRLLKELPKRTLDAVVAGHSHLPAQEVISDTPVIEAQSNAKIVGVLHLKGKGKEKSSRFDPFIAIPDSGNAPDITELLKPYRDTAAQLKTRPVGEAASALDRNYWSETALGNLLADVMREAGHKTEGAQFGLVNAGGIRAGLPSGKLTYGDVFNVAPFDNSLAVADLSGAELRRVLEIALSGGHGVAPVSGLRLKVIEAKPGVRGPWDRDLNFDGKFEDWERNLLVEVTDEHGEPLRDDRRYKLATIDFLTSGGDHQEGSFNQLPASRIHVYQGVWLRDLVADYLKKVPRLSPEDYYAPSKARIQFVPPPHQ